MGTVLAVAAGGAIGSVLRHLTGIAMGRLLGLGFPWGTLTVNIIGSALMGVLIAVMALRWPVSTELRAFLTIGLLGGYTTFSSFSLDVVLLWQRGEAGPAILYVVVSVAAGLAALFGAMKATGAVLA